ncbi:27806_t:CDS:2, partial [Gigaspora margarita]
IQAKIRQYKPYLFPEKKVTKLHKRIAELQEEVIRYPEREELKIVIEQLQEDLQEELTSLAERWQIQSNTHWIEEEEQSTKYFFARYRSHYALSLIFKVKIPNKFVDATPVNILQYAKETYKKLYKLDRVNLDATTEFSVIDQTVSEEQNYELWPWDKSSLTLANTLGENCTIKGTVFFLKEVTLQNIKNKSQIIDESIKSS